MTNKRSAVIMILCCAFLASACSPSSPSASAPSRSAEEKTSVSSGLCPSGAREQVETAMGSGLYRVDMTPDGAQIYISTRTATALGQTGLELLALNLDCSIAGPSKFLTKVSIRQFSGSQPFATFNSVELLQLREKYERSLSAK
jgi:hypothetical protein